MTTNEIKRELPSRIWSVIEFGPGNRWVYTSMVSEYGKIGVIRWDPLTGESLPMFGGTRRDLFQIAVSGDGQSVMGSIYEAVRVWRFKDGKPPGRATKQLEAERTSSSEALAVSFDGNFVATASLGLDSGVYVWDVEMGIRRTLARGASGSGREVAFHPTKPLLAFSAGTERLRSGMLQVGAK